MSTQTITNILRPITAVIGILVVFASAIAFAVSVRSDVANTQQRVEHVEQRVDKVETSVTTKLDTLQSDVQKVRESSARTEEQIRAMRDTMIRIERNVDARH